MTKVKMLLLSLLIISALLLTFMATPAKPVRSKFDKLYTVKLYAGEKLVATWEAIGEGRHDGESFVFNTSSTIEPRMIRIHGTYSVEQTQ